MPRLNGIRNLPLREAFQKEHPRVPGYQGTMSTVVTQTLGLTDAYAYLRMTIATSDANHRTTFAAENESCKLDSRVVASDPYFESTLAGQGHVIWSKAEDAYITRHVSDAYPNAMFCINSPWSSDDESQDSNDTKSESAGDFAEQDTRSPSDAIALNMVGRKNRPSKQKRQRAHVKRRKGIKAEIARRIEDDDVPSDEIVLDTNAVLKKKNRPSKEKRRKAWIKKQIELVLRAPENSKCNNSAGFQLVASDPTFKGDFSSVCTALKKGGICLDDVDIALFRFSI